VVLEQTGRGFCTLRVRDDGAGFQDTESPKDPDKLRLELIKILTKQIRGELVLHGGGSREIEITFPFLP
jgi:two-component sensor histidine kinase